MLHNRPVDFLLNHFISYYKLKISYPTVKEASYKYDCFLYLDMHICTYKEGGLRNLDCMYILYIRGNRDVLSYNLIGKILIQMCGFSLLLITMYYKL